MRLVIACCVAAKTAALIMVLTLSLEEVERAGTAQARFYTLLLARKSMRTQGRDEGSTDLSSLRMETPVSQPVQSLPCIEPV
jgi:hypothetical protein